MEHVYVIEVTGPEQVAWLTNPEHYDGEICGGLAPDGTVILSREAKDALDDNGTGTGQVGDLEWDDERQELLIWLPRDGVAHGYPVHERQRSATA